jgi:gliding motility-associated-like protein
MSANAQTYFLQGDAQFMGDDCYRLTTALNNQNGAVWYAEQIDLNQPFDLEFLMNFGDIDANGADGICFVLQTVGTNALGESGGGLGFLGFSPAFAVEFDTWQNMPYGDPFYDHIAMVSNGDVDHFSANAISPPVQASSTSPNIEDGLDHIVRITWFPDTQEVSVYFDCDLRQTAEVDLVNSIFNGESLVYWGFTAATGGAFNNQTVCLQENIVPTGPDALVCTGASIQLSAGGDPNSSFLWSPETYLDDPFSQTPICTPENNITYTVTYTDLCGNEISSQINVEVDDLTVEISGLDELNCYNETSQLTASVNFPIPNTFNWQTQGGNILTAIDAPFITIDEGGVYSITVIHNEQCEATAEFVVTTDFDDPLIIIDGGEALTCFDPVSTLLATTDVGNAGFSWSSQGGQVTGDPNDPSIEVATSGTYTVSVINLDNGCSSEASVEVINAISFPQITMGQADTLSCRQPQVIITGSTVQPEGVELTWSHSDNGIIAGGNTLEPVVNQEGYYLLSAFDPSNGCSSADSTYVFSDGDIEVDFSSLTFPNVFSPNNDGVNDRWFPVLRANPSFDVMDYITQYELQVFNRWGSVVYENEGKKQRWDGRDSGGNVLNDGVYLFIIQYDVLCGTPPQRLISGDLHLQRNQRF